MATAESFLTSDAQLAALETFKATFEKYSKVADDATIETVKAALEKKNHKVTVVASKEEALKAVIALVPEGASVHNTSSTTLVRPFALMHQFHDSSLAFSSFPVTNYHFLLLRRAPDAAERSKSTIWWICACALNLGSGFLVARFGLAFYALATQ